MIDLTKEQCIGCGACAQACSFDAITIVQDEEGFNYPKVNSDKCTNCNKCQQVCPVLNLKTNTNDAASHVSAYALYHLDDKLRYDSSSGGAFSLFAEKIIDEGGIVYGCALDDNLKAVHIGVDSKDMLYKLRGSKYVQSDTQNIFNEIRDYVKAGRKVLFCGSPCQAASLHTYISEGRSNLYILDFICHGVPSPKVFEDFIKSEEKRAKKTAVLHKFRNKDKGWNQSGLQLGTDTQFNDGSHKRRFPALRDSYMNGFLDDLYLRPSCYNCSFKSLPKDYADITIADFWGINKVCPEMNDNKGTSLVLIHNQQGNELWNQTNSACKYQQVDFDKAISHNKSLVKSAALSPNRDKFFNDYLTRGYDYAAKKHLGSIKWIFHKCLKMTGKYEQFIKFGMVGVSNTAISLITYYIGLFLGLNYLIAYMLGFLMSVSNAFYWNNKYIFVNKTEKSLIKAYFKTLSSYGLSFLLSVVLIGVLVDVLKISSVIAPLIKMIVTIPINFVLNKLWAFKDRT